MQQKYLLNNKQHLFYNNSWWTQESWESLNLSMEGWKIEANGHIGPEYSVHIAVLYIKIMELTSSRRRLNSSQFSWYSSAQK